MLEPNEEKLLEETYKIEKDNNEMLHVLYKNMIWGRVFTIFYWILILGIMIGSVYFAQPYVAKIIKVYNQASGMLQGVTP